MKLLLNNEPTTFSENITLTELLWYKSYPRQGIAVIINERLIPYGQYDDTHLAENDAVEIFLPMQGG